MHTRRSTPWAIRALVRLYPLDFRQDFGREVEGEAVRMLREAGGGWPAARAWGRIVRDMSASVVREHWDTWFGDVRRGEMGNVILDVRRVVRGLAKTPGFTLVVLATLGLGIGATTSIYSVVHGVLLAPLPYPDQDRIVSVAERMEETGQNVSVSYMNGVDWKAAQSTLDAVALVRGGAMTLSGPDGARQISVLFADPEYFGILGAEVDRGRLFDESENRTPGGHAVAVLTHDAWQRLFGSDPSIVGRTVNLGGEPFAILGVLSATYRDLFPGANGSGNDLVVPAMMAGRIDQRGDQVLTVRRWRTFGAIGKLGAGVDAATAEADLRRIAARLEEVDPVNRGMSASVQPYNQVATQTVRGPALTLLGGALVLLIIACFNVANLLLVRGASRRHELALQFALGAGRGRLFRLLAVESVVLAVLGGALGVALSVMTLPTLLSIMPVQLPPTADVRIDVPVLSMALAVSLAAGVVFGLLPALRQGGGDLRSALAGAGRSGGERRGERVRSGLVVFELATATVLLAASAVLIRSFQEVSRAEPGFETENVLTLRVSLPPSGYADGASMARAAEELGDRLAALPGAEWARPWGPGRPGQSFSFQTSIPQGRLVDQITDAPLARRHHVAPGTLEDLGIELLRGRAFTEADRAGSTPVAIVSESLAEELWPGEDPIGRQYHSFQPPGAPIPEGAMWTVVGLVRDARHGGRVTQPGTIVTPNDSYFPLGQRPERAFTLLVKFSGAPEIGSVREAIRAYDPNIPITQIATMAENFAQEEGTSRFAAQLMGGFGLTALLLAALGVYGVIAFTVSQRTREIGLRAALGADSGRVLRRILRRGLGLAVAGVLTGVLAASAVIRGLRSLVPNLPTMDAPALALASASLLLVALFACLVPARRATRVSPVVALKSE